MRHTAISKLLGTTVGVKIKNTTVVGLLVGIAWDKDFYIITNNIIGHKSNNNMMQPSLPVLRFIV